MKVFKKIRAICMMICSALYLLMGISPIQAYAFDVYLNSGTYVWPNIVGNNTTYASDQPHVRFFTHSDGDGDQDTYYTNDTGNSGKWIWSKYEVTTQGNLTTIIIEDLQLKAPYTSHANLYTYYDFAFPGAKEVWTRRNTWGGTSGDYNYARIRERDYAKADEIAKDNSSHYDGTWSQRTLYSVPIGDKTYENGFEESTRGLYNSSKEGAMNYFGERISLKLVYENLKEIPKITAAAKVGKSEGSSFNSGTGYTHSYGYWVTYIISENESISSITGTQGFSSTVKFDANGGTVSENTRTVTSGGSLGNLPTASKTGYILDGWYTAKTGGTKVDANTKVSADATYYAHWTPRTDTKYTVKHYQQNVTGSGYTLKDTDNLTGTTDSSVTPVTKAYTGFTAPARQTVTVAADGSRVVTYNYTRNKYTATFNGNGGTASKTSSSLYYGSTLGTLPTATRTGYTFKGWYTAKTGGTKISSSETLKDNTTYYAQWTPVTYTITYKLNGGKVDYKKVKYNIETPTFYIENPTKKGFTFTGWTGTGISTATTDLSVPLGSYGNKTFEATWGNGVYAISFDGNGATSGFMETINVKAGESVKLPENSFTRDGYSFVGWYTTKEDRFGTFYRNGATITDLTESVTLHAQWKKEKPSDSGNNGNGDNGNTGDNGSGDNGSGNTGDNGDNGNNGNNNDDRNITPKDEIGYFGTGKRTNEISILTTLGMQDKKLTLNYNY